MSLIMVTGASGQLGNELNRLSALYPQFQFHFSDRDTLSITDYDALSRAFDEQKPRYVINCAAYTAVDKAETDTETARLINATASGYLAKLSKQYGAKLVHVSTDYVYDGSKTTPYIESDTTNPLGAYGHTKLEGEQLAMQENEQTIILRTAWVYSSFGNNFVKTMMRLMKERENLNVVADQVGSPTYAKDLAEAILDIISKTETQVDYWQPGIYHYTNDGKISWYDFAVAIKETIGSTCNVHPITTDQYPTPAKRPAYSLLDKGKFVTTFHLPLKPWRDSLDVCIKLLQES
jgi:dTDP-4-dehydrorhamnose reductase